MEGEMKRKIFAVLEELEIDAEGRVVVLNTAPEILAEPSVIDVEVPEVLADEVATEEVVEPIAIEAVEAETIEAEPEIAVAIAPEVAVAVDAVGEVPAPKYVNKNFAQKMMLADEVIQDRYDEVKNYALRFKRLKARISKKFESINQGRLQFVKLSVAGKTLKLYLNMDISEVDPKFRCKDMRDKVTYETVPTMLRIKSGRAVRYAKILIDQCAAKYGLVENKKFVEVDAMKVVEDFLLEREAKRQAKLGGGIEVEDVEVDDVLEEIATTDIEEVIPEEVAVEETIEEPAEETIEGLPEEAIAEEVVEEPTEEVASEEVVEESAEETIEEVVEEPAEETIEEATTEEVIEELPEEEAITEEAIEELSEEEAIAEEIIEEPAEEVVSEEVVEESAEETIEE